MKLIHCADLHLDSPMTAHLSPEKAKLRREELRRNFLRLVEAGDTQGVEAILIAGDLFDEKSPSKRSRKYVLDVIAQHPNLFFFYLSGNHDGFDLSAGDAALPQNLFLFDDSWKTYDLFPGLTVTGSVSPDASKLRPLPEDTCNLLLLHGQVLPGIGKADLDSVYPEQYRGKNIDYLALGHLHSYSYTRLDARTAYCYSGCLEGRGFDETGEKGYVLLEFDGRTLHHTFVPFAKRRIHIVECDVTDCTSALELESCVNRSVVGIPSSDLLRLILCGTYLPDAMPDAAAEEARLSEQFFYAEAELRAKPLIRREDYETDVSLKGAFVRTVSADENLSPDEADKIILCGLRALMGEEPIL